MGGSEDVRVQGDIIQASVTDAQRFASAETYRIHAKRTIFTAEETFSSEAKRHFFRSEKVIILLCGESVFILYKDGIVIDGPDVLINPGPDVAQAVANGASIKTAYGARMALDPALRKEARTSEGIDFARKNPGDTEGNRSELMRRGFTSDEANEIVGRSRQNRLDDR